MEAFPGGVGHRGPRERLAQAPYINDYIPDIRAQKNNKTIIIEVETEDTLRVDVAQHGAFQRHADESPGVTFLLYLAGEDGACRLIN